MLKILRKPAFVFPLIIITAITASARQKPVPRPDAAKEAVPKTLAVDPAVASGTLANGMKYYIVTNATETGLADFALVRRIDYEADADSTVNAARNMVTDLPRFKGRSSRRFLSGNGAYAVPASKVLADGNIFVQDNALVYRFGTLPVSARGTILDSTLLMIFDIVEEFQDSGRAPAGYSTSDNAVIVSGDVDKASVLSKLQSLSLMVEKAGKAGGEPRTYEWRQQDSIRCTVDASSPKRAAVLKFTYASSRTPDKYIATSLPDVSSYYAEILGIVLRRRIYAEIRGADIPLADVRCRYVSSGEQPGDERFEITVCVAPQDVPEACRLVASVITDIGEFGMPRQGFAQAREQYLTSLYISSQKTVVTNSDYVDKCLSAFLYGTTPATDYEKWSFVGKGKADESGTNYFNNFATKLLAGTRNLTISLTTNDGSIVGAEDLKGIFRRECEGNTSGRARRSYSVNHSDTLGFGTLPAGKIKVVSERTDAVSGGGTKWVFSNGMNVIYRRMDTGGLFYYNLLIRGGFSSLGGLDKGEGAFLNDMLSIYNVGGVKGENFQSLMQSNGITFHSEVTVSDMSVYGVAERPSLTLLMKALTALTTSGEVDRSWFDYYRRRELLRLEAERGGPASRTAAIDSLLSPTYRYYADKMVSGLHEDLADLAEGFFRDQFSRVNDGVLVIVGDMNEDMMKKFLLKFIGGFPTGEIRTQRARIEYSPIVGQETLIADGERKSVDVAMSIPVAFTADNYMVMKVTELALQDALNRRLVGKGAVARVRTDFFSYPQERAVVVVSAEDVDLEALPLDEIRLDHPDLLFEIGQAISGLSVGKEDLAMYKTVMKNQFKARQDDPWYWIHMVKTRVSAIKDLNSKYSDRIDAVTAEQVSALVSRLDAGSKVEYVLR